MRIGLYKCGVKPLEFDEMTVEQCGDFLSAHADTQIERFKEQAILLDGLSNQITTGIAGLINGKNKRFTLNELYPDLFGKKSKSTQTPKSETDAWLKFLFG